MEWCFPGGKSRCLTLSYDDGVEQDIRLVELMKQYGIAGTFNVNGGLFAPEGKVYPEGQVHRRMTEAQCKALYSDEPLIEVATHGYRHIAPDLLTPVEQVNEIMEDRKKLEQVFGRLCRGHALAHGRSGEKTQQILADCGIVYARTIKATHGFGLPKNFLEWDPTCHHTDPRLMELADKFLARRPTLPPTMFYLWGHTYEFEDQNNWEVIESFFRKVSGHGDIWYATNIQIYEYINAQRQLIFYADGKTVYNPTQIPIWYKKDGGTITIAPGATVTLP